MASEDERKQILELIDSGKISVEDGIRLLQSFDEDEALQAGLESSYQLEELRASGIASQDFSAAGESFRIQEPLLEEEPGFSVGDERPDFRKFRQLWAIPFWVGISITILGSLLMYAAVQGSVFLVWLFCASAPFFIGLALAVLAWQSRTAHWMHLRVQQKPGERPERISLSFPVPIRLAAWFFRTFRYRIPQLENTAVDEIILALGTATSPDNPLFLQVDEGEDGEKVQIYIG